MNEPHPTAVSQSDALLQHPRSLLEVNPDTHELLGRAALEAGNYDEAEQHCRAALQLDPNRWTALYSLGRALEGQGRKKEAAACFDRAARLHPSAEAERRKQLKEIGGYPGLAMLAAMGGLVLFRLARYILQELPENQRDVGWGPLGAIIVVSILLFFMSRERRIEQLHRSVAPPSREEMRRKVWERIVGIATAVALVAGGVTVLIWTFIAVTIGPADAGLRSPLLAVYIILALGTPLTGALVARRWWEKRRPHD